MLKRILVVALAVVAGDWVAMQVLPRIGINDDQATVFDMYDVASALIIGVVYVGLHKFLKL